MTEAATVAVPVDHWHRITAAIGRIEAADARIEAADARIEAALQSRSAPARPLLKLIDCEPDG